MNDVVLDASALLALLHRERGAELVAEAVPSAAISAVNLSEVVARLTETGVTARAIHDAIDQLGLDVIPFDEQQAYQTGLLRASTQALGLSLGDRACLSLAKALGVVAITADKAWAGIQVGTEIRVIR